MLSKRLENDSEQYMGSIHILITDLYLQNIIKNKVDNVTKYIILDKQGNLIAASDRDVINAQKDKVEIDYGSAIFKFPRYIFPYKQNFLDNEVTLWSGVNFDLLLQPYKKKLLQYIFLLNIGILLLIGIYFFLLRKGVELSYKNILIANQALKSDDKKSQESIIKLSKEIDELRIYIEILKSNYLLEYNFLKNILEFEYKKLNDSIGATILIKKYITENNYNNFDKISELVDIVILNNEKLFFTDLEYSKEKLDLVKVFDSINEFFAKIFYEKRITINQIYLSNVNKIYIEKNFLTYLMISIIGHMVKGLGKGAEINIEIYKSTKSNKKFLEIILRDTGFGINLDEIFLGNGGISMDVFGVTGLVLSSIEECNKLLRKIGGELVNLSDTKRVNQGSIYRLSIPSSLLYVKAKKENKYTVKEGSNVIYLSRG